MDGVPVYPMSDMKEQVKIQQIDVAILTVPAQHSQDLVNELVKQGLRNLELYACAHHCTKRCADPKC